MIPKIERLRELFSYDPEAGILTRKFNGCGAVNGRSVHFDEFHLPKANIMWALYYGEWPTTLIDHKDRNCINGKIINLRKATTQQNSYNFEVNNLNGRGVYNCGRKSKPWQAQIRIDGQKINLGRFATKEEAAEAYSQAALKHRGEFACLE